MRSQIVQPHSQGIGLHLHVGVQDQMVRSGAPVHKGEIMSGAIAHVAVPCQDLDPCTSGLDGGSQAFQGLSVMAWSVVDEEEPHAATISQHIDSRRQVTKCATDQYRIWSVGHEGHVQVERGGGCHERRRAERTDRTLVHPDHFVHSLLSSPFALSCSQSHASVG